ncbi:MAG: recombinase family protein [Ruminococcaceae bacterium]|nr:recombinase family protein [Oscillospiraceae bacterium]
MIFSYCRVSTQRQNLSRQIENVLRAYPTAIIIKEAFTGTSMHRPEWMKLMRKVQSGDTIVFDEVSRMSRDSEEGFQIYEELYKKGVALVFLKEPHINTSVYQCALDSTISKTGTNVDFIIEGVNKYLMALAREQIKLAFEQAEKEVSFLRTRVKEGLQVAKENGTVLGRTTGTTVETQKSKEAKAIILKHSRSFGGSLDDGEVMQLCGVSRNSFYKYKKELMA